MKTLMHQPGKQRGASIVVALFLLVVLASIAVFIVRLSGVQQQSVNLALLGSRAFYAARSGIEWGAWRALNGDCSDATVALTEAGLSGFNVAVTCRSSAHQETSRTVNVYVLESFAQAGTYGEPDYVSRRLRATISDAPAP
jgi:MSHA biogenesis protein MshP